MALTIAINASTLIICSNVNLHVVIITYKLIIVFTSFLSLIDLYTKILYTH